MSSWIKIVVIINVSLNYISCLKCLSRSLGYHFAGHCIQLYMNIACRSTQNATCIKWRWCFKSKRILRPLPTSVHSNTWQLALQVWHLAKFISGWADRWFIESLPACILRNSRMTWLLNSPAVPSNGEFSIIIKNVLCYCHFYNLLWKGSVCFDRPEYWMSAICLVRSFCKTHPGLGKHTRIISKIGQKMTNSVRGLNNRQHLIVLFTSEVM